MTQFQAKDALPIRLLSDTYGQEIALDDEGREMICRLLQEFRLGDRDYAVLLPEDSESEYLLLRIVRDGPDGFGLESIDDDEEWEAVAEVYDEMTFEP